MADAINNCHWLTPSEFNSVFAVLSRPVQSVIDEIQNPRWTPDPIVRAVLEGGDNGKSLGWVSSAFPRPGDTWEAQIICVDTDQPNTTVQVLGKTEGVFAVAPVGAKRSQINAHLALL